MMAIKHTWKDGVLSINIEGWHAVGIVAVIMLLGMVIGVYFANA